MTDEAGDRISREDLAIKLLELAIGVAPTFAALVRGWISGVPEGDDPLVDRVRAILPVEGASTAARRELEARRGR